MFYHFIIFVKLFFLKSVLRKRSKAAQSLAIQDAQHLSMHTDERLVPTFTTELPCKQYIFRLAGFDGMKSVRTTWVVNKGTDIVTRLAWIAALLVSSKRETRYAITTRGITVSI